MPFRFSTTSAAPARAAALALAILAAAPGSGQVGLAAQNTESPDASSDGWNRPGTLELVARARAARQRTVQDSSLTSYQARARGYVYFFLDREDTGERTLVKADQVALDIYWREPGLTKQHMVGRRDERKLPTRIRYHLDHLTVVQDDFGDRIRLGDGDEVSSVVHPMAPGSGSVYDFRLADSITIRLGGGRDTIRVYELEVRPRHLDRQGFLGSVFVDRQTADIVRMSFTFTPASYVDPYLDYIRISLDNARWLGGHWLPYRQQVEIRRELPQLDVPAGTIIRGTYEIGAYDFNQDLPAGLFRGGRVSAPPRSVQEQFDFEEGLYAGLDEEGLAPTPELAEIRQTAARIAAGQMLSGLAPFRLYLPSSSEALRYNRAEGTHVGLGIRWDPGPRLRLKPAVGWAFAREKPWADVRVEVGATEDRSGVEGHWHRLMDLGVLPGSSGAVNTLAATLTDTDYLDAWFASGVSAWHRFGAGSVGSLRLSGYWERHRSARDVVTDPGEASDFRPVRSIDRGDEWGATAQLRTGTPDRGFSGRADLRAASFEGSGYAEFRGNVAWAREWLGAGVTFDADFQAGLVTAGAPAQRLFVQGGRMTLPGYDYRSLAGDAFWLLRVETSKSVWEPWIRLRGLGSVGRTYLENHTPPPEWDVGEPSLALFSAGAGLGLLWDVLHLDFARGLNGGEWDVIFSVHRRFWGWL